MGRTARAAVRTSHSGFGVNEQTVYSPLISAIFVSWNRRYLLEAAIQSLRDSGYPRLEYIVVDNHSSDGSAAWCESQPDIHLIRNRENLGASFTRNQGSRIAHGQYLLFMDSDAVLMTPDGLQRLVDRLEGDESLAAVSGIYYSDEALTELWCWSPCMDWEGGHDTAYSLEPKDDPHLLSTCFMLCRADVFRAVGGFDEYFFYLYDDADLTERMRKAGYNLKVDPEVKIWHRVGRDGRIERDPVEYHYYYEDLRLRFLLKNFGMKRFLRSCLSRLLHPRRWKPLYYYFSTIQINKTYLYLGGKQLLAYPSIKRSRGKRWV